VQLTGIHHLTAISAKPRENLAFYTGLLGMRLVKKTVNQDDVSAYHLFYADGKANPGTDLTFFDFAAAPERRGANSISRTGLRVAGEKTLGYWRDRLKQAGAVGVPRAGGRPFQLVTLRHPGAALDRTRQTRGLPGDLLGELDALCHARMGQECRREGHFL
jgi:catechol 2,3-dioxygenase-like lactoylglutathione lyase family enzyme